jgi:hypothetical protein
MERAAAQRAANGVTTGCGLGSTQRQRISGRRTMAERPAKASKVAISAADSTAELTSGRTE